MTESPEPTLVTDVSQIADKIRFARSPGTLGDTVFLIGAGCSISAGIPAVVDIGRRMARDAAHRFECCSETADSVQAYKSLVLNQKITSCVKDRDDQDVTDDKIDWYGVYAKLFGSHYAGPDYARELFGKLVSETEGAINWAHLCLGELVAQKFVSTVLTTNFDQLVLSGMIHAGVLPVMCDGIESLHRISGKPQHPQLVELHGSRNTYVLRNSEEAVQAVRDDPRASAAIRNLLYNAKTFVAVGYGGREEGVMDLLIQAAKDYYDKDLFWVEYSSNPKHISSKVRDFLLTSKNGRLFVGQDADRFFLELCKGMKISAPLAIFDPLETVERLIASVEKARDNHPDIKAAIDAATARVSRLRECDKQSQERDSQATSASAMRERRLSGDAEGAYNLGITEIEG